MKTRLNYLFEYNNGHIYWKNKSSNMSRIVLGSKAGYRRCKDNYLGITINSKSYLIHRIIYIMYYGDIPNNLEIDHINGICDDNRIENLRLINSSENNFNRKNVKGCKLKRGKYESNIDVYGRRIYLGTFNTEKQGIECYQKAKQKYHKIGGKCDV